MTSLKYCNRPFVPGFCITVYAAQDTTFEEDFACGLFTVYPLRETDGMETTIHCRQPRQEMVSNQLVQLNPIFLLLFVFPPKLLNH